MAGLLSSIDEGIRRGLKKRKKDGVRKGSWRKEDKKL
jgi:hypothetical protein